MLRPDELAAAPKVKLALGEPVEVWRGRLGGRGRNEYVRDCAVVLRFSRLEIVMWPLLDADSESPPPL